MRSTIIAAAFAVSALAVPYNDKRSQPAGYGNVEVVHDVVYVTNVVTITAGVYLPTDAPKKKKHHGHQHSHPKVEQPAPEAPPAYTPPPADSAPEPEAPAAETPEAPAQQAPAYQAPAQEAPASYSSSGASAPSAPASDSYKDKCLYHHNIHRANHTCPDVEWSDALAITAGKIAGNCTYAHDTEMDGGGYGQNIAAGITEFEIGTVITDMFYNSEEPLFASQYGSPQPDMSSFMEWGHFTQVVWCKTRYIGCATVTCDQLKNVGAGVPPHFTVCNYDSPGNFANEYAENVKPPRGDAMITAKKSPDSY